MIRELITFEVEGQVFGLDIMAIREIRAWTPTTRLPRVPHYVAGVVNLRGTVLPVVDLAARLGWRATEPTPRHAIIVTQLGSQIGGWIVPTRVISPSARRTFHARSAAAAPGWSGFLASPR